MFKIWGTPGRFRTIVLECRKFSDNIKAAQEIRDEKGKVKEHKKDLLLASAPANDIVREGKNKALETEAKQEKLMWRTPWHQKDGKYYDILRTFYDEHSQVQTLKWIQSPINLTPSAIKNWWLNKKEHREAFMQQYIPERHQILGPELAAAHFVVHRGGAVKFLKQNVWIKAVDEEYQLPRKYQKDMFLEAIDCTDMNLHYEGLDNLRGLRNVTWLSLNGCKYMDDFCLDAISNMFSHSLVYLDIRNCYRISDRGLGALYKMRDLKILYLDDLLKDTRYELTCLLLEELNPNLQIKSDKITFEIS